jgi:MATE family multidrug resistance protein
MGMAVVDVMVVGQIAPAELPHQALGWAPIGVLMVTGIGLLTGVQVLAARALGAGKPEEAGAAWRRGMVVSLMAGIAAMALIWLLGERIFAAFGIGPALAQPSAAVARILAFSLPAHFAYVTSAFFFESIQRPLASTIVMLGANVLNLVLNLALVPTWGAEGSAWATVAARAGLGVVLVVWVLHLREHQKYGVRRTALRPGYRELLAVGSAAAISHAAEAGAFSGMTLLAGRIGAQAVANYQVQLNLLAIVFMISLGLASATAVLTSEAVGRRSPADATRASFVGLAVNAGFMSVAAALVWVFSREVGRAYTADPQLGAGISSLLWLTAVIILPDCSQVVAASALRARGDNWLPTASHLLAYALVMPAVGFWLAEQQGRGVAGLLMAILAASWVSCAVLFGRLWSLRRSAVGEPEQAPAPHA